MDLDTRVGTPVDATYALGFISGSYAGTVVPLGPAVRVGSDPSFDVCLQEPGVDPHHAQMVFQGGWYQLMDLGSVGGTFVDGERVVPNQAVRLKPGSLVRFGEGGPLALLDGIGSLQRAPSELVLVRDDGPGGQWRLNGALQVGRGDHCDVTLDPRLDVLASQVHLHLTPVFGGAVATDLGSVNGTWQNGTRIYQRFIRPGEALNLGGASGPSFRVTTTAPAAAPTASAVSLTASHEGPPQVPETFWLDVSAGGEHARIQVIAKTEARFGSFAGLNDFETTCFPRDLESEEDALDRAESIGPQHGSVVLLEDGVELRDGGFARTKVDGLVLEADDTVVLDDEFEIGLGDDVLCLKGRIFTHPNLEPTTPQVGMEGQHPVECVAIERMGDGPDSRLFLILVRQASVGSADEAAIRIPVPGVAPQHALLYLSRGALWVTQIGDDPVAVNGLPLSPGTTVPLALGSEFYAGTAVFRVSEE